MGGPLTSSTTPAAGAPVAEAVQAAEDTAVATPVLDDVEDLQEPVLDGVEDLQDEFHDFDDLFDQQNEISMITEAQPEEEEEAAIMGAPVAPRTELDRALPRRRPDRD